MLWGQYPVTDFTLYTPKHAGSCEKAICRTAKHQGAQRMSLDSVKATDTYMTKRLK